MPRTLTDEQKTALTAEIGDSGVLEILVATNADDGQAYADQLSAVFTAAGWTALVSPGLSPWIPTPTGLSFMAQSDLQLSEIQHMVISGLNSGDIEYNQLDAMLAEGVDVKLLVGRVGV